MCDKHSQDERPISDVPTEERFLAETMAGNSGKDTAREQEGSEPVAREKIGRYQIEKVLGTGAMGAVYLARDETLDRRVAIKIPKFPEGAGDEVIQRFYREARSAAAITHPNICAIYDIGEEDGTYFIAMQYVEGHSLSDYVESHRQPQQQVAIVVRKIALAMHEAHLHKLVHRDLKPPNALAERPNAHPAQPSPSRVAIAALPVASPVAFAAMTSASEVALPALLAAEPTTFAPPMVAFEPATTPSMVASATAL